MLGIAVWQNSSQVLWLKRVSYRRTTIMTGMAEEISLEEDLITSPHTRLPTLSHHQPPPLRIKNYFGAVNFKVAVRSIKERAEDKPMVAKQNIPLKRKKQDVRLGNREGNKHQGYLQLWQGLWYGKQEGTGQENSPWRSRAHGKAETPADLRMAWQLKSYTCHMLSAHPAIPSSTPPRQASWEGIPERQYGVTGQGQLATRK